MDIPRVGRKYVVNDDLSQIGEEGLGRGQESRGQKVRVDSQSVCVCCRAKSHWKLSLSS